MFAYDRALELLDAGHAVTIQVKDHGLSLHKAECKEILRTSVGEKFWDERMFVRAFMLIDMTIKDENIIARVPSHLRVVPS